MQHNRSSPWFVLQFIPARPTLLRLHLIGQLDGYLIRQWNNMAIQVLYCLPTEWMNGMEWRSPEFEFLIRIKSEMLTLRHGTVHRNKLTRNNELFCRCSTVVITSVTLQTTIPSISRYVRVSGKCTMQNHSRQEKSSSTHDGRCTRWWMFVVTII